MKLTKRQLKRIIREEYTRLKRRGLIRENFEERSFDEAGRESKEYIEFVNLYHESSDHDESFWQMWYQICEEQVPQWNTDPYHLDELVELATEPDEDGYIGIDDEYFSASSQR